MQILGLMMAVVLLALANAAQSRGVAWRSWRAVLLLLPLGLAWLALDLLVYSPPDGALNLLAIGAALLFMLLLICLESAWQIVERGINLAGGAFAGSGLVQRTGLLLLLAGLAYVAWQWARQDADAFALDAEPALLNLGGITLLSVALAAVGVGWRTRRNSSAALRRLGLRLPLKRDWTTGLASGVAMYVAVGIFTSLWRSSVGEADFAIQTEAARALFDSFNSSLLAGLMLALLSAIGEEILFRGAMQPVFGIGITSLAFSAIHMQYAQSPAIAIIFGVSLAFGVLRSRGSTSAAIIAHACYNALPFLVFRFVSAG